MPKRIEHKIENGNELKWCSTCQNWFPLKSFRTNNAKWDRLDGFCSACAREVNEQHRRLCGVPKRGAIYKTIYGEEHKKCRSCKKWKPLVEFRKAKGQYLQSKCKECCRADYLQNKEQRNESSRTYRINHREQIRQSFKEYWQENLKVLREKSNSRQKIKYQYLKLDPIFKIHRAIVGGIRRHIQGVGKTKENNPFRSTERLLIETVNTDYATLQRHLELQFESWMTWENYGNKDVYNNWSIDHIVPIKSFKDLSFGSPEFKQCWSLENLRPLRTVENIAKKHYTLCPPELEAALDKAKKAADLARVEKELK